MPHQNDQPQIKVLAEHGAWTWFNDERAIVIDSLLYVGYVDTAGYSSATVYNLESGSTINSIQLGSFKEIDDHNNPAFMELNNGSVLATYAAHHTQPYWYWRFASFNDSREPTWSDEQKTKELSASITYTNLFQLPAEDGLLYNFFRGYNFDPNFMTSDDEGHSWSEEQHFISSGGGWTRPYMKYASNGQNRIDMLFTQAHPRDAKTNIYHAYYQDGKLYKSDGEEIQDLPGENTPPMNVDEGTLIYNAQDKGRAWVWDLEYGTDGQPVAVFVTARDSTIGNDLRYHYARWNEADKTWNEQEIAYAGTHLYDGENHYAGGIVLDPADPNIVYTSSDLHPETGDTTDHYQLYRGVTEDEGDNWSWTTITPDATEDNIRPFVPRGKQQHVVLWLRGRYTTYTNYDMKIMGLVD
ncbi:BNR-4 repeat-containing protein [Gracilimonas mengyeensis]|uniref:BNR-4 repeat-containing protein n=1 Tax=Gracilimonas mengyeensis TaxID=1302730 RepID=UPI001C8F84DA|nr:BNR-4 repeat-containing protein [Gracilimonas mengyeensis]